MTSKTKPETVVIAGHTFKRPFNGGATFAASIGAPINSWLTEVTRPDGETGLAIADARVFAAFGIRNPDAGEPFVADGVTFDGYVVGYCGHRVAGSEWRAGFRTCERCPVNAYDEKP